MQTVTFCDLTMTLCILTIIPVPQKDPVCPLTVILCGFHSDFIYPHNDVCALIMTVWDPQMILCDLYIETVLITMVFYVLTMVVLDLAL